MRDKRNRSGMEHMGVRWYAVKDPRAGVWCIEAATGDLTRTAVAVACTDLPGDRTGYRTARAICKAHNKELEEKD